MAARDLLVRHRPSTPSTPGASEKATRAALILLGVSVCAAIARVLSRVTMFTGGRNVEYELRAKLLAACTSSGRLLPQDADGRHHEPRHQRPDAAVRLLGFGLLNIVSSGLALASALYVGRRARSLKLTLAAMAVTPILMLITRSPSGTAVRAHPATTRSRSAR